MAVFESFRAVRWLRTLNLLLQAVLFLTFFGGLNYLARNHSARFDLTKYRRFSLSAETTSYIKNLPKNVHIVATVSDETELPVEVKGLLDEYVHATETNANGRITYEVLNVYRNRRRGEELGLDQANVVMLVCGDRRRAMAVDELYDVRRTTTEVVRQAFKGERVLTAATLEISNPDRQHIYFLVGHRELQPDDTDPARGLSELANELRARNFAVDTLDLSVNRRVPEDAALLVSVWPTKEFSRSEQEMLRQYMTVNAGRVILLLGPGASSMQLGLDQLLIDDWGVLAIDDWIWESDPQFRTDEGDLIVKTFIPHAITDTLINYNLYLRWGYTRTVMPHPSLAAGSGLHVTPLIAVSKTAWGDVGHRANQPPNFSNRGNTHPIPGLKPDGHLAVAVASERIASRGNLAFSVRAGRMVVFGSGDFVANQRIRGGGNGEVFLRAVNWAVERDKQLTVPVRPIQRFQLAMSAGDLNRLNYTLWFALPGIVATIGILVYWSRRK